MDTRLNYAEIVKRILCEYIQYYTNNDDDSLKVLFDDQRQRYLVLDTECVKHFETPKSGI